MIHKNINSSHQKKNALLILHQKRSRTGDLGIKLIKRGYSLDIRRPSIGDKLPETMDNHDLAIIFGGPMSVNDLNMSYIKYEIDWINVVLESKKPFLGICLGAQMFIKNLGGEVECNTENSSEIGFFNIKPTTSGLNLFKDQKTFFHWHNEGFNLPSCCELLAEGERFKNQAFKCNKCFGIQFHPEVNFRLHLLWLYYVSLYSPKKLIVNGAQNLIKQINLRIKHNRNISLWLDNFLDNYLLNQ